MTTQVFGYAITRAQAQTAEGAVTGANPAQPCFLAGSACLVDASFYDINQAALVPAALSYRIDDTLSGDQILGWTAITPAATLQFQLTAAQNALVSNSRTHETHQVLFQITDPSGNGPFYARCLFDLLQAPGVA